MSLFSLLRGIYSILGFVLIVTVGLIFILLTGWWPIRVDGVRLGPWIVHYMARIFARVVRFDVILPAKEQIQLFDGFIFANHTTYMDILTLVVATPVRFVAKDEIRRWPGIGQLALAIDCVFVKRENKISRKQARQVLVDTYHRPPIVLFPEGRTAPMRRLLPFRRGAFEIAHQGEVPYALTAIIYSELELVNWKNRPTWEAWWEMLSRGGRLHATLHVIDVIQPQSTDDPTDLCENARQKMLQTLVEVGHYYPDEPVT